MAIFTLKKPSEGEYRDRGSKFYAFAYPVREREEIDAYMQALRKRFHDARHVCVAFRLGDKGETVYANDDGEPSNSAGAPILAAIRSSELTNVVVAVVRYFGGIKLGVRGLIDAYRSAAQDAIQQNTRLEIIPKVIFRLEYSYAQTSEVNRILHRFDTERVEAAFTESCRLTLAVREEDFSRLHTLFEQSRIPLHIENP